MAESSHTNEVYVPDGMPPLDLNGRSTSFFEFWPMWLMYVPVVLQWLLLSLRYRSLTLPLIANPAVPMSGLVGAAKSAVFEAAGAYARQWILPWLVHRVDDSPIAEQRARVLDSLQRRGLQLPIVGKPDIGCRGAGVKLLQDIAELDAYIAAFPVGGDIQFQQLSRWQPEAGVFYVREPGARQGRIISLALKYTPYVVGDGQRRLAELVADDPRAGHLLHLYRDRHVRRWYDIIPDREAVRLVFSASHCRGAVFRDATGLITDELSGALDAIFDDIPEFHYGRLDIKFRDVDSLRAGRDFEIIEINGASSESINIWDRDAGLWMAVSTLLQQYSTLFKLGLANRQRGHITPGIGALWRAWRHEINLVKQYPHND